MAPRILERPITQIQTIYRTRRRAFALISGIVLATMIISGIILYSSVLQQRNFESIVGDTAYEVKFDKFNNENFDSLNQVGQEIINDDRIDAYSVVAGRYGSNSFTDFDINIQTVEGAPYVNKNNRLNQNFRPLFVDNMFFETSIGLSITDRFFEGDFRFPTSGEVIVPRSVASETGVSIGDTINRVNFTIQTQLNDVSFSEENSLTNLTIIGIYDQGEISNFIDFDSVPILNHPNLILNNEVLNSSLSNVHGLMMQTANFELLVSIDETKFTVSEPELFVAEIDRLMNQISEEYGDNDIVGTNLIGGVLLGFTIFSIIVSIMYVIISLPVIALSLYVLNYGLTVSLEERKREIAIKKVQGANGAQIFKEIRNETLLVYLIGLVLGYILATIVAFVIGNAVGFFQIEFGSLSQYMDYAEFNLAAVLFSTIGIGLIVIFVVYRQAKTFINEEVSSAISKKPEIKYGFLRSTNLDIVFFIVGLIGFGISFGQQILLLPIDATFTVVLIQIVTPFFIWIGGAVVGSRIVKFIPQLLEPIYLRIFLFKDVSRVIKAGLRRRGDVNKLAIVIILALAVSSMAVIQGVTDEAQAENNVNYQVGADIRVTTSDISNISSLLLQIEGVEAVQEMPQLPGRIFSSTIGVVGIDPMKERQSALDNDGIMEWQRDSFAGDSVEESMTKLIENPRGVYLSPFTLSVIQKEVGDIISISVPLAIPKLNQSEVAIEDLEIVGTVEFIPGELNGFTLVSHQLIQEMYLDSLEIDEVLRTEEFLASLPVLSSQYMIDLEDEELTTSQISQYQQQFLEIDGVSTVTSLQQELNSLESSGTGFGITGLLTLAAAVSLLATFVSSFAFSSIIMERRKREFAVLRAIGAKKSQIYKLALGENALMMLIGVVWGTMIGIAVAVIFNGFFGVVSGELLRNLTVTRQIIFPWIQLTWFAVITFAGMMVATMLSIRQSVNADLTTATRAD